MAERFTRFIVFVLDALEQAGDLNGPSRQMPGAQQAVQVTGMLTGFRDSRPLPKYFSHGLIIRCPIGTVEHTCKNRKYNLYQGAFPLR